MQVFPKGSRQMQNDFHWHILYQRYFQELLPKKGGEKYIHLITPINPMKARVLCFVYHSRVVLRHFAVDER